MFRHVSNNFVGGIILIIPFVNSVVFLVVYGESDFSFSRGKYEAQTGSQAKQIN